MNIEVLEYIVTNAPHYIEELAEENRLDETASIGVAKYLIGEKGDVSKLSSKQKHHYEKCIQPLLENVRCDGVFNDGETCVNDGYVDGESLLGSYMEDDFKCQLCRSDSERFELG